MQKATVTKKLGVREQMRREYSARLEEENEQLKAKKTPLTNLSSIRVACSPLTGEISAGRLNKKGDCFLSKTDVTQDVLKAVVEKIQVMTPEGTERTIKINVNGKPKYELTLKEVQ